MDADDKFAFDFAMNEIERDIEGPALPGVRCLVLQSDPEAAARREVHVLLACSSGYRPYDRAEHTYAARTTTCPECLAVQAARCAVLDAEAEV